MKRYSVKMEVWIFDGKYNNKTTKEITIHFDLSAETSVPEWVREQKALAEVRENFPNFKYPEVLSSICTGSW